MRWRGNWSFNNVMHYKHGNRGTEIVVAPTEDEAREAIKQAVSRKLFDSTMMQRYVAVSGLIKIPN